MVHPDVLTMVNAYDTLIGVVRGLIPGDFERAKLILERPRGLNIDPVWAYELALADSESVAMTNLGLGLSIRIVVGYLDEHYLVADTGLFRGNRLSHEDAEAFLRDVSAVVNVDRRLFEDLHLDST